jgi:hypothetical protein
MNPVENESVVVSAIERCGGPGNVEIVDCSSELPNLKRYPGLKDWKIMDKSARIWSSWKEVEDFANESAEGVIPGRVVETMFPRLEGSGCSDLPLERCMRVYPHMQDTGGFFITVLEKKSEFKAKNENEIKESKQPAKAEASADVSVAATPSEKVAEKVAEEAPVKEEEAPAKTEAEVAPAETEATPAKTEEKEDVTMDDASTNGNKRPLESEEAQDQPAKKVKTDSTEPSAVATPVPQVNQEGSKPRRNGPVEEAFKYLDISHPTVQSIKEFYHISKRFPDDRYMVRNEMGEPAKAIYYTSALLRDILVENEGRGIKFIHGGVRMYMKQDAPSADVCRWRIQAEGMPILQGYVGEPRVVHLHNKETFRKLLIEMFPRINDGKYERFDEIGERVRDIGMGCAVLRVEPDGTDPDFNERMALPLWKSIHSLNLMLPKEDRSAMLLRIFNDTSPLINIVTQKHAPKAVEEDSKEEVDVADLPSPEESADVEAVTEPAKEAEAEDKMETA